MSSFNLNSGKGGYVFISHAHKDIKDVRLIRNILEDNGFEPICFYLRCLSDDEIIDLIKREIDARECFLLADSQNAKESKWVQTEREYIESKDKSKIITVPLDEPEKIPSIIDGLMRSMRVFLSYSHADLEIAKRICEACLEKDLKIFMDYGISPEKIGEKRFSIS